MRIALRSVLIGDGGDAAAARAIHTGLTNAGVDVVVEGRDTGVPVTAIDAPAPPERNLPVDAHIQWCTPADLDPDVVAPVRVAKLCDAGTATGPRCRRHDGDGRGLGELRRRAIARRGAGRAGRARGPRP